ncbi:MAG: DUF885 family protein, partial [Candidatus Aminicenantaceae bacterium]
MKKTAILLFALSFVVISTTQLYSQRNAEDEKFQKLMDSYFDAYWKFFPTAATLAGFHKYNDKLEDFREKNIEKRRDEMDKFHKEIVVDINSQLLSPDFQIDHALIVNALDLDIMQHEMLVPWDYNPLYINTILMNCIRALFKEGSAPTEALAKNADSRLKSLERFISESKKNLKTPAEIYTQTAINQFPTINNFYHNELPGIINQCPESVKAKLQANLAKILPALDDYQNFLQNELLPRSTGSFRLMEAHARLVRTTFQNDIPVQELLAQAEADAKNIRNEMFKLVFGIYQIMDPVFDIEDPPANLNEDQLYYSVISHVFDKIKNDHVTKDEFVTKVNSLIPDVRSHLTDNQFVDLPADSLEIVLAPPESLQTSWLKLIFPAPYDSTGTFSLQISPMLEDIREDKLLLLLEEYTNNFLPFWTAETVYPGYFVPAVKTHTNASIIRKLFPNMPVLMGWPYMFGEQMMKSGYGNYDLKLRLNQLKLDLRPVVTFIIEFQIHQSSMEKEDAINYMKRIGFFSQTEAERIWDEILLNPLSSAYQYVGMEEYRVLEEEYKKLKGDSYNHKDFMSE